MAKLQAPPDMIILHPNGKTTHVYVKAKKSTNNNYNTLVDLYAKAAKGGK